MGDGNIHIDIVCPSKEIKSKISTIIDQFVYSYVASQRGSINAEHGIGQLKAQVLKQVIQPNVREFMLQLRKIFDPNGILQPNKIII